MMRFLMHFGLRFMLIFLLIACSAPTGGSRIPLKISALSGTAWYNYQQGGLYFALAFQKSGNSYYVGSASGSNLDATVTQATGSAKIQAFYDEKTPGEIQFNRNGAQEIFRPADQSEAQLIISGPNGRTILMKRYR